MNKAMENELYSFIVDSNLEYSLVNQCKDEETKARLEYWLGIKEVEE